MKPLLLILTLFVIADLNAQTDSSKLTPTVTLQARDIEYFVNFTFQEAKYNKMDSVFISILNGSNPPSGTTTANCTGVQARHWLSFFEYERTDPLAIDQGVWGRLKTALNATSHTWLTSRITTSDNTAQNTQSDLRTAGRKRARKERDDQ